MDARGHSLGFTKSPRISIINRWPWWRGPGKVSEKDGWCTPRKMVGGALLRFDQDSSNVATILMRLMVTSFQARFFFEKTFSQLRVSFILHTNTDCQLAALESLRVRNKELFIINTTIKRIIMCLVQSLDDCASIID